MTPIPTDPYFSRFLFQPSGSSLYRLSSLALFHTRCGFLGRSNHRTASHRVASKGGPFSLPHFSLLFFSHPLKQHYLIIDRMILLSVRMARPAERTFHFVNLRHVRVNSLDLMTCSF